MGYCRADERRRPAVSPRLLTRGLKEDLSMEPFLGQINVFPYTFAPKGWMLCNGQQLPINQWQALFSLLGTSFGGDGRTTFALPNLQRKSPGPGLHYYIAVFGIYPSRP
jgi:microcystin-dependent protein